MRQTFSEATGWFPLRASIDHRFIVGALRARRKVDYSLERPFPHHSAPFSLKGVAETALTARIERAQFHRARSASKKGTWPLPPHPSEAARCASTEDHQAPSPPPIHTSTEGSGRGCPLLRASNEHILIVRVLRARRAPGHSLPILPSPLVLSQGWGLIDLPLPASMTKIETGVTVEGARQRAAEDRRVCSGLESDAAGLRSRRLH
jgi:hypothetical protein